MCPPTSRLNRLAAGSTSRNTKDVVWEIGTARAPVTGSGCWPACSASVSGFRNLASATGFSLLCGPAAIGHQRGALHVGGGIGGEEDGDTGALLRRASL